jgi:uncharacterized protein (TIGR02284 family)
MLKNILGADKSNGLNCLIKANRDGAHAYRVAAEMLKDQDVKDTFLRHAEVRSGFANELSAQVERMGLEPPSGGSLMAKLMLPLKLAWIRMMGADTGRIVAAAEGAEDCAMKAYDTALKAEELKGDARELVKHQRAGIRDMHNAMRLLELRFSPAEKALPEA